MRPFRHSEVHESAAVHAVLEKQVGILLPKPVVNLIVSVRSSPADIHRIARYVTVPVAGTRVYDHDLVVLQQVELVLLDHPAQLLQAPCARVRVA